MAPEQITIDGPVYTTEDELGGVPEADQTGDQTGGMGAL
jgi:hypothetical protein